MSARFLAFRTLLRNAFSRRVMLPVRLVSVRVPRARRFGTLRSKIVIDARFDEPLPDAGVAAWHGK